LDLATEPTGAVILAPEQFPNAPPKLTITIWPKKPRGGHYAVDSIGMLYPVKGCVKRLAMFTFFPENYVRRNICVLMQKLRCIPASFGGLEVSHSNGFFYILYS